MVDRLYADRQRHLVADPPTRENLLRAAIELDIPAHWYHASAGRLAHIDIPVRQVSRVLADPRVTIVSPREIVAIHRRHERSAAECGS